MSSQIAGHRVPGDGDGGDAGVQTAGAVDEQVETAPMDDVPADDPGDAPAEDSNAAEYDQSDEESYRKLVA